MQTINRVRVCVRVCTHIESQSVCTCPVNEYFECEQQCACVFNLLLSSRSGSQHSDCCWCFSCCYNCSVWITRITTFFKCCCCSSFVNDNLNCCCCLSNTHTHIQTSHIGNCRRTNACIAFYCTIVELQLRSLVLIILYGILRISFNYHSRAKQLHELILSFSLFLPYLLLR